MVDDAIHEPRSDGHAGSVRNIGVQPIKLLTGFGREDDAIEHRQ
jgi:hypothetical protein